MGETDTAKTPKPDRERRDGSRNKSCIINYALLIILRRFINEKNYCFIFGFCIRAYCAADGAGAEYKGKMGI
jgi:hypothetical protein